MISPERDGRKILSLAACGVLGTCALAGIVHLDQKTWPDARRGIQPAVDTATGTSCSLLQERPQSVANVLHAIAPDIKLENLSQVLGDDSLAGADYITSQAYRGLAGRRERYSFGKAICSAAKQNPGILQSEHVILDQA